MSRMQEYRAAKRVAEDAANLVQECSNRTRDGQINDPEADKAAFVFVLKPADIGVGYYGCSSFYQRAPSEALLKAMNAELARRVVEIGWAAVRALEADAEKARVAARDEAAEIMREVTP